MTFLMIFTINASANTTLSPDQMTPGQQAQLIQLLNQLEPGMIDTLLSDEALDWYIEKFTRGGEVQVNNNVSNDPTDIGGDYQDPNAPQFL